LLCIWFHMSPEVARPNPHAAAWMRLSHQMEPVSELCPPSCRGLHPSTSQLNLRTLENISLPLKLNVSAFGPRPRVHLGCMEDKVSLI
jgi:hypothetical protein